MAGSAWRTSSASAYNGDCAEVGAWRKAKGSMGNGNCAEIGAWRKSSASITDAGAGSECAEVAAWRKSAASGGGVGNGENCAEVGAGDAVVGVRDTKQADLGEDRTVLEFSLGAWDRFLAGLKD